MLLGITRALRIAYEQECKGLTALERGVLWSLAAIGDCKWCDPAGVVRAEQMALMAEMGMESGLGPVLESLQRKGKIRIQSLEEGRVVLQVCFWYDRFFKERESAKVRYDRQQRRKKRRGVDTTISIK
jgi:hypothetical protein